MTLFSVLPSESTYHDGSTYYDVKIDNSHSEEYHIDFNVSRVQTLLNNINSNKAMGPDKIHGMVLRAIALICIIMKVM